MVIPSSNFGKNYLPRLGAALDISPITDVLEVRDRPLVDGMVSVAPLTQVKDENTFVRPMYAGNALATVKSEQPVKVTFTSNEWPPTS